MCEHDPLMRLEDDPSGSTVHQPYSAFNQGFDAGKSETPISVNPYEEDSREFRWWNLGHEWATCPNPLQKQWG